MATWHQVKGAGGIGALVNHLHTPHAAKWKVVSNPPNECCSTGLFDTEDGAKANKEGLERHHPRLRGYVHIIPPKEVRS